MNLAKTLAATGILAALAASPVHAVLTTNPLDIGSPNTITFDEFDGHTGVGPTQVGASISQDVVFTASLPSTLGAFIADLGTNGVWGAGKTFAATGAPDDVAPAFGLLHFTFTDQVTRGVGAVLNTFNAGPILMVAYGADTTILEAHVLSVSTPDALNEGSFFGITRAASDIRAIAFGGTGLVLDDLVLTTPVPEPGVYAMMLCGLGLVGWVLRKRKKELDATRLQFH